MSSILSLFISSSFANSSDTWVVEPHQLSQIDLWIERAHGIEDRKEPLDIFVDVDGSLMTLNQMISNEIF